VTAARSADELGAIRLAAEEIAREAGALLQQMYAAPLDVRYKARRKDRDPVTAADEAVEAFVRRAVAERFPAHGVLGEEADDTAADAEFLWVVDPLDGTANFASGLPLFACSIGVLRGRRPAVAALYVTFGPLGAPALLSAQAGGGLRLDGQPYAPRQRGVLKRARAVGVPAGFHRRFRVGRLGAMPTGETRSLGSIAVELGLAATGTLQYAVFGGPKIWDVAAGVLLCQESGRVVLLRDGRRWRALERFETPAGKPLREWSLPLIAGEREALRGLVPRLGVRRHPLELVEKLLGPARAKQVKERAERLSDRLPERWRR
jgi:myo-inositol-1(or 4)-monophosphatase